MGLASVLKQSIKVIGKYSPQILTGLGIAGFLTSIVFAVEATPEAYNKIKMEEYKRTTDGDDRPVTVMEIVSMTWKDYVPTVAMATISTAMIIGGQYMQTKKTLAMTAAYTMLADQTNRYYERTKLLAGKQKAEDIRAQVSQDLVNDIPEEKFENAPNLGGDDWFVDALSGQVFRYDIRKFEHAVNVFNQDLLTEMWKAVNDLYDIIGLDHTIMGEILGYDISKGLLEYKKPYTCERNGKACFVLMPQNYPEERKRL